MADRDVASVNIAGLTGWLRAMEKLGAASADQFRDAGKVAGQPALAAARRMVPTRSGRLAATIRLTTTSRGVRIAAGGGKVKYAAAVHFGYRRSRLNTRYRFARADIKANPFLFNAVDATAGQVAALYLEQIEQIWEANNGR